VKKVGKSLDSEFNMRIRGYRKNKEEVQSEKEKLGNDQPGGLAYEPSGRAHV
jgi:hypothetical protein